MKPSQFVTIATCLLCRRRIHEASILRPDARQLAAASTVHAVSCPGRVVLTTGGVVPREDGMP